MWKEMKREYINYMWLQWTVLYTAVKLREFSLRHTWHKLFSFAKNDFKKREKIWSCVIFKNHPPNLALKTFGEKGRICLLLSQYSATITEFCLEWYGLNAPISCRIAQTGSWLEWREVPVLSVLVLQRSSYTNKTAPVRNDRIQLLSLQLNENNPLNARDVSQKINYSN